MALILDKPLESMSDRDTNARAKQLWETESLGGLTEDNNRLPIPIVWLLILTIFTAFAITFPLWGQRPNAAIYVAYVKSMDDPALKGLDDEKAMAKIVEMNKGKTKYDALLERHPVTLDDLRIIRAQVEALLAKGADLEEYNVVGTRLVMANFQGNVINGRIERKQPWWDKGYTIDIFFILFFFTGVVIAVKRLPPNTWQPTHTRDH